MKEDVLEQVVEDYLHSCGYFTRHNLRFRPDPGHPDFVSRQDSVRSDVDVVGVNPLVGGRGRAWVVSCKSWQSGFDPEKILAQLRGEKKNPKRETWRSFRELWVPKWSMAFRKEVFEATGEKDFTYSIAVTKLSGGLDADAAARLWDSDDTIAENLRGCEFSFLTMREMWDRMQETLTTTPAPSEIGRLAQLLRAAGMAT